MQLCNLEHQHTARIVTGREQNATCSTHLANDMAGRWCTEDAVLSNDQLLHAVCSTNLGNQLDDLWIVVSAIAANDQKGTLDALWDGEED